MVRNYWFINVFKIHLSVSTTQNLQNLGSELRQRPEVYVLALGKFSSPTTEKNPWSRDENQQQIQPTCVAGSGNQTRGTAVGGEHTHHCGVPASPIYNFTILMPEWSIIQATEEKSIFTAQSVTAFNLLEDFLIYYL